MTKYYNCNRLYKVDQTPDGCTVKFRSRVILDGIPDYEWHSAGYSALTPYNQVVFDSIPAALAYIEQTEGRPPEEITREEAQRV